MEVVVKDLFRHTVACDACRIRKRRCDGKAPCSYCVAKNQPCNFSERKKRGPAKRPRSEIGRDGGSPPDHHTLVAAGTEGQMLDKIEAAQYLEFCWKFIHRIHPLSTKDKLLSPVTIPHKVQAYGTFAYMARICGDVSRAKVYMNQARMLAGSIYDSPEPDSVAGLLIMSIYYALVLDMPRTVHYASVAWSLTKMIGQKNLNPKLRVICHLTQVASNADMGVEEMSKQLNNIAINEVPKLHTGPPGRGLSLFLDFNSSLTRILGCNMLFPSTTMQSIFQIFDGKTISEEDRIILFNNMNSMITFVTEMGVEHMMFVCNVLCPMYKAIINWKSGHVAEGLAQALDCLQVMKGFDHSHLFGMLSHFPQICVLGCLVSFFLEQKQYTAAVQMSEVIKAICKVMSPEFDFIIKLADELVASIPPDLLEYPPFQAPSPSSSSSSSSDDDSVPFFSVFNPFKVITITSFGPGPEKPEEKSGKGKEKGKEGFTESCFESTPSPETDPDTNSSTSNSDNELNKNNTNNNNNMNNNPNNNLNNTNIGNYDINSVNYNIHNIQNIIATANYNINHPSNMITTSSIIVDNVNFNNISPTNNIVVDNNVNYNNNNNNFNTINTANNIIVDYNVSYSNNNNNLNNFSTINNNYVTYNSDNNNTNNINMNNTNNINNNANYNINNNPNNNLNGATINYLHTLNFSNNVNTPNTFSYNPSFYNMLETQPAPSPPSNTTNISVDPIFYTNPPLNPTSPSSDNSNKNSNDSVTFEVDFTNTNISSNDDVIANILNNADSYLNLPEMEFLLQ